MLKTHIPFLVFPAFPGSGLPSSECRVFSAQCSEMEGLCFGTDQGLRVERDARALYESRTTQKFGACDHFQPRGSFATHTSRSIRNTTRLQACATDSLGFFVATRGCLPQSVPILYHFGLRHGNEAYLYSGAHHVLEPAVGWVDQCC